MWQAIIILAVLVVCALMFGTYIALENLRHHLAFKKKAAGRWGLPWEECKELPPYSWLWYKWAWVKRVTRDRWWDFKYWLYIHPHMIDLRKNNPYYKWGYCEVNNRILFAAFTQLTDYFDNHAGVFIWKEADGGTADTEADWNEMAALVQWWKVGRAAEIAKVNQMRDDWYEGHYVIKDGSGPDGDEVTEAELVLQKKESAMFSRIGPLLPGIWTA